MCGLSRPSLRAERGNPGSNHLGAKEREVCLDRWWAYAGLPRLRSHTPSSDGWTPHSVGVIFAVAAGVGGTVAVMVSTGQHLCGWWERSCVWIVRNEYKCSVLY